MKKMTIALMTMALLGCQDTEPAVRPGSEPLDRLLTPRARALAQTNAGLPKAAAGSTMCTELVALATQGRLILERSTTRIVVNRDLWQRLPAEAQAAMVSCSATGSNARPRVVLADDSGS